MSNLNQAQPIYHNGKICYFIKWNTLSDGKIKVVISKKTVIVDYSELSN